MTESDAKPELSASVRRWWTKSIAGLVILAATLFLPAGRVDWTMGWAFLLIITGWVVGTRLVSEPELLAERAERRAGTKRWDTVVLSLAGLGAVARPIVAGLDQRYGWTGGIAPTAEVAALVLAAAAYALVLWATSANAFFSKVVRIQRDRGQTVATGGPYRFVRHPGYLGEIVFELVTPIMLGSVWALIPGSVAAGFFVLRTVLEDRTLQRELEGYQAYAHRVGYRLVPGVW